MPSIIKAGVKAESRKRLIALWKANAANEVARMSRDASALGKRLGVAQDKAREAFLKALDDYRGAKAFHKEMAAIDKAIRALAKRPTLSPAQLGAIEKELQKLRDAADAIEKTHRPALLDAFGKRVSADTYRGGLLKAMKKPGRLVLKEGRYGGLINLDWITSRFELLTWTVLTNPETSFAFTPAYDDDAVVANASSTLAGTASAATDPTHGSVSVFCCTAIAGYQMARSQVGAFLTIPSGFETLRLQARIVDIRSDVMAIAIVGGSWASTGTIAEVTVANNTTQVEGSINYVVAPLVWYAQDSFKGSTVLNAEFEIPSGGGDILVTAGIKSDVWAAVEAGTSSLAGGTVEKITVELA
jgi:hypothetical protein